MVPAADSAAVCDKDCDENSDDYRIEVLNVSIGPIGDLGDTSTAIAQQAQIQAQQNAQRTQQARTTQQVLLEAQDEQQAQQQAQVEANQRADDRQAALQAFGIQQAQLQDAITADRDLQAAQQIRADQAATDQATTDQVATDQVAADRADQAAAEQAAAGQQSFDQAAVDALLRNNGNTTIATPQDALDEFAQFAGPNDAQVSQVSEVQVSQVSVTVSAGDDIDTQL